MEVVAQSAVLVSADGRHQYHLAGGVSNSYGNKSSYFLKTHLPVSVLKGGLRLGYTVGLASGYTRQQVLIRFMGGAVFAGGTISLSLGKGVVAKVDVTPPGNHADSLVVLSIGIHKNF